MQSLSCVIAQELFLDILRAETCFMASRWRWSWGNLWLCLFRSLINLMCNEMNNNKRFSMCVLEEGENCFIYFAPMRIIKMYWERREEGVGHSHIYWNFLFLLPQSNFKEFFIVQTFPRCCCIFPFAHVRNEMINFLTHSHLGNFLSIYVK